MMLKLLAKEVHQNAVEHGFYDGKPPSFLEVLALCHSELSEALEEYQNSKPFEYKGEDGKPLGAAVEMVDCMLRILDWFGYVEMDVDRLLIEKHAYNRNRPYRHGKPADTFEAYLQQLQRRAEEHAKQANETLAAVQVETREWGKLGDDTIIRYVEVGPSQAWENYNRGIPVETGKAGTVWVVMPWSEDGGGIPIEWFKNEAKHGAMFRIRNI